MTVKIYHDLPPEAVFDPLEIPVASFTKEDGEAVSPKPR